MERHSRIAPMAGAHPLPPRQVVAATQPSRVLVPYPPHETDRPCVSLICQGEPTQEVHDLIARHQRQAAQAGYVLSAVALTDDRLDTVRLLLDHVPQHAIVLRIAGQPAPGVDFAGVMRHKVVGRSLHPPLDSPALAHDAPAAQPAAVLDRAQGWNATEDRLEMQVAMAERSLVARVGGSDVQ